MAIISFAEAQRKYNRLHFPARGYRPLRRDLVLAWGATDDQAFREDGSGPDGLLVTLVADTVSRQVLVELVHFPDQRAEAEARCLAIAMMRWPRRTGAAAGPSCETLVADKARERQESGDDLLRAPDAGAPLPGLEETAGEG